MSVSKAAKISVLLADSRPLRSQLLIGAMRRRPEFSVVLCPLDAEAIVASLDARPINVLLLVSEDDIECTEELAVMRRVHYARPEVPKILLLGTKDTQTAVNAFRCGVRGVFCYTEAPFRALCKCIHRVHEGQYWLTTEQLHHLMAAVTQIPALRVMNVQGDRLLTPREEQVVALVADGLSNRQVAAELGLSEHTIKKYLLRIFDKLGVSTRVELVLYAMNHGETRQAEWMASPN